MNGPSRITTLGRQTLAVALGRSHRLDPVLDKTGGPAGNARLTAWAGLILLVLFLAELATLFDVRGLISWHLALGAALVPPSVLKTGSTAWRIVRYYNGNRSYREAGPPQIVLRVLGPLVVGGTLAVLGTGLVLVLLGESSSRRTRFSVLGSPVSMITLHQAAFAVWAVVTALHVLTRLVPALQLVLVRRAPGPTVPSARGRAAALVAVLALSVGCAGWILAQSNGWQDDHRRPPFDHPAPARHP